MVLFLKKRSCHKTYQIDTYRFYHSTNLIDKAQQVTIFLTKKSKIGLLG